MSSVLTKLVNAEAREARSRGIEHTPGEIAHQANFWMDTLERVRDKKDALLQQFESAGCLAGGTGRVIFAGAGSSDFVGQTLVDLYRKSWGVEVRACPTTDIVTHPQSTLAGDKPTLLVSIARSGNSPESVAAFDFANRICPQVQHAVITCNSEGELARRAKDADNATLILLHPETNDKGLAMTASFTNMLIAGQALTRLRALGEFRGQVETMGRMAKSLLTEGAGLASRLAEGKFSRAVFLGSGSLTGIAAESALKLQELTDGLVMTAANSFLGFRHGPEAVVNEQTLMVYLVSADAYVRRYEYDLINQIKEKRLTSQSVAIGNGVDDLSDAVDSVFDLADAVPDELSGPLYVIFGQLLGLFKSLNLGMKPDNPSARGAIHRVVQGVRIYPFE